MSESVTRRQFLVAAAFVGAGLALTGTAGCSGPGKAAAPGAAAASPPVPAPTPARGSAPAPEEGIETPSWRFGEENGMSTRVLVGYATRTGSTAGVAEAIGKTLAERGCVVDVKPLRQSPSLDGYDACVIGSAVNGGEWLPEALDWVRSRSAALRKVPVSAFCVHSMNGGDDAAQTRKRLAYLDGVRAVVRLKGEAFFLGKGPTAEDTSLIARWAFKKFGGTAEGDARDWDKIRRWAERVTV